MANLLQEITGLNIHHVTRASMPQNISFSMTKNETQVILRKSRIHMSFQLPRVQLVSEANWQIFEQLAISGANNYMEKTCF